MNVIICGPFPFQDKNASGGIENHIFYLARELVRDDDINVRVMTLGGKEGETSVSGIKVSVLKKSGFPFPVNVLLDNLKLKKRLDREEFDILHLHTTYPYYSGVLFGKKQRYKTVLTVHNLPGVFARDWNFLKRNTLGRVLAAYAKSVMKRAGLVAACSPFMKRKVEEVLGREVPFIMNGIDAEAIASCKPEELPTANNIVFAGRLVYLKGVDLLIEALGILLAKGLEAHLYIAGDGPAGEKLREFSVRKSLASRIDFCGTLPFEEVIGLFKAADICVFPSRRENLSLACLEAMACGKAVIATSTGSFVYLIEDGVDGLLVQGEPEELADKIEYLLNNPAIRKEIGRRAAEKTYSFSWSSTALDMKDLYRQTQTVSS